MKYTEYEHLKSLFKDKCIPTPIKSYSIIKQETANPNLTLKTQIFVKGIKKIENGTVYSDAIKSIGSRYRNHMLNFSNLQNHQRKVSNICARELRRALSKTSKTNPNLKNKRINKELNKMQNRISREEKDKIKKEENASEAKKKNEDLQKEELRQKRKFNYLMSQTEAFASFFLNRKNLTEGIDMEGNEDEKGVRAVKEQLAHIKDFDDTSKKQKYNEDKQSVKITNEGTGYEYREVQQPEILNTKLKDYQLKGLNWLVNLYNQGINGILADDMGLGKTVQAISLLGYLAETENVWGPFLIITPASTLHNWENEFHKFVPDFKVLNYYGSILERTEHRKHFKKANVIVTSYQVAVMDESFLKKVKWQYMILDEAQAIKSINSQRWKILLSFKARNRCLLTGTPIQNNMQELWSLLHFIMPTLFDSLSEFSEWFLTENKVDEHQISKLHTILKPFMLRRHKDDIKDEIGTKEIVNVYCTLSTRQRILYDDILQSKIDFNRNKVAAEYSNGGNTTNKAEYENIIMHLKKVCNHPNLFEKLEPKSALSFSIEGESSLVDYRSYFRKYISPELLIETGLSSTNLSSTNLSSTNLSSTNLSSTNLSYKVTPIKKIAFHLCKNIRNSENDFIYADLFRKRSIIENGLKRFNILNERVLARNFSSNIQNKVYSQHLTGVNHAQLPSTAYFNRMTFVPPINTFISDSGKLVELDNLLRKLKGEGHRVLIYFQMTRMMDLFEEYLVKLEYSYLRLDGSSKINTRAELVTEWQTKDIFIFILSTRAGGVGINLTAADTVIFYDSDWNPTVDQQAMDRVHRLGQTKNVTVYRLITMNSIEEKVMERANKKDEMQKIVIQGKVFEG